MIGTRSAPTLWNLIAAKLCASHFVSAGWSEPFHGTIYLYIEDRSFHLGSNGHKETICQAIAIFFTVFLTRIFRRLKFLTRVEKLIERPLESASFPRKARMDFNRLTEVRDGYIRLTYRATGYI